MKSLLHFLFSPFGEQNQTPHGTQVRTTALRNEVEEGTIWPELLLVQGQISYALRRTADNL